MERWRWMPENLGPFYVWDSVPEQMTKVFDEGKLVLAERIVVGKPRTPTPMFSADMLFVIFHPSWGVPPGMKANELLPQLRESRRRLFRPVWRWCTRGAGGAWAARHARRPVRQSQLRHLDGGHHPSVRFVQPPGPKNVLGMVKFRFPNKHNVYMHDTPERHLFGGGLRTFSHGCMRVQNPVRFAEVLLARDKGRSRTPCRATRGAAARSSSARPSRCTSPTSPRPSTTTARCSSWPDIYALDGRLASALGAGSVVTGAVTASSSSDAGEPVARPKARVKQKAAQQSTDLFSACSATDARHLDPVSMSSRNLPQANIRDPDYRIQPVASALAHSGRSADLAISAIARLSYGT